MILPVFFPYILGIPWVDYFTDIIMIDDVSQCYAAGGVCTCILAAVHI